MSSGTRSGGLIYFIKPAALDGPIKIGHSRCPEDRLINLSVWSPWPLHLIGAVKGGGKEERFLHQCFADCHSHREWFHSNVRLRETIDKILQAGTIDAVRADLKPTGSIRLPRHNSPEGTRRMSYRMRIYWVLEKLKRASGIDCYFKLPGDVEAIVDRWCKRWDRPTIQPPNPEEIARLEAFISNPIDAVRVEHKLRVVK
jgi:hypothetical protein